MLSLITTFFGVLAKQWLYQYMAVTPGEPHGRALVRQARNLGLNDWHVPALIGILPIVLHISLALFFAGLVIPLRSRLPNISYLVASIVGTVYVVYIVSNILPLFYPRCPYRTALTPKLYLVYGSLPTFPRIQISRLSQADKNTEPTFRDEPYHKVGLYSRFVRALTLWYSSLRGLKLAIVDPAAKAMSWRDAERNDALNTKGELETKIISELYTSSYNPSAKQVVLEALAGYLPEDNRVVGNWEISLMASVEEDLRRASTRLCSAILDVDSARQLELYLSALTQIQSFLLMVDPGREQRQLLLPHGVTEAWKNRRLDARLRTLLACGFYRLDGLTGTSVHFLDRVLAVQEGPKLPAGTWMSLFRNTHLHSRALSLERFKSTVTILRILKQLNFFASPHSLNDRSSFHIRLPNKMICIAMFEYAVEYWKSAADIPLLKELSLEGVGHAHILLRCLLAFESIVYWQEVFVSSPEPSKLDTLDAMDITLDCLLQAIGGDHTVQSSARMLTY